MRTTLYYFSFILYVMAPPLATAQEPDSVHVVVEGVEYPAYAAYGTPPVQEEIGPLPLAQVEPFDACAPIQNVGAIAGKIAFVSRGTCSFTQKVDHIASAGAEAIVVMNNDAEHPDSIFVMAVDGLAPDRKPAVMVSYNSGLALLDALPTDATLVPVRIAYPLPTVGNLNTTVVETALFDNGFIGNSPGFLGGPGFSFNGEQGLHLASLLLGRIVEGDTVVGGRPYEPPEYETIEPVRPLAPPFPPPFAAFDEGYETTLASAPLGVAVTARAYARSGDAFVVFDYALASTTGETLGGVYAGLFADLDAGDFAKNLGGFDAETGLVFAYDSTGTSASYFGVAALQDISGWTLATDPAASGGSLFQGLTTAGAPLDTAQDVRAVVGTGPLEIGAEPGGEPARVRFALVAGEDEAAVLASARAARSALGVSSEATTAGGRYALGAAYPNPSRSRATVSYAVPRAERVRLAVYDVLGREVGVLVDGVVPAGAHAAVFEASGLPSGVYVVRLKAGGVRLDRRLTLLR